MYIKGTQGPIEVTLPSGDKLNMSDLPAKNTTRWVASRKLVVVNAVVHGLISAEQACTAYDLSQEELDSWISHTIHHGPHSLKATKISDFRQP